MRRIINWFVVRDVIKLYYTSKLFIISPADPILIARALQDYYPGDCRFIPIRQGQLIYVYSMLKDRGNLFWTGSVRSQSIYHGNDKRGFGYEALNNSCAYHVYRCKTLIMDSRRLVLATSQAASWKRPMFSCQLILKLRLM